MVRRIERDVPTDNATTDRHGHLKKLSGSSSDYMDGSGNWSTPAGSGAPNLASYLVSGGQVAWVSGYQFRVSAAVYVIQGVQYTSTEQTVTLTAASATDPRIDVIAVDNTGTVVKVTGTASTPPSEPDIDPGTQLQLSFVTVDANTTQPSNASSVLIYAEDTGSPTEWDWTTSGSTWALASTVSPRSGSKCILATALTANSYAQGQKGSSTLDPSLYDLLVFFIESTATWTKNRGLNISLRSSGVLVGQNVVLNPTGTYGFTSSNTSAYQQVAIPLSNFGVPAGTSINQVRFTDFGGAIGFRLDDISIQKTGGVQSGPVAPVGASYLVLGFDSALTNERVFTPNNTLIATDGGANGNYTVKVAFVVIKDSDGRTITTEPNGCLFTNEA